MICDLCPRSCGALRTQTEGQGYCRMPEGPVIARAALHFWEEPCISGSRGSGAVFFSGCNLGCVFCQNGEISHENFGRPVTAARLREIFEELIARGAHNINLVSPGIYAAQLLPALQPPLPVPVVYNCGGYEKVETLRLLEGRVQIYLPDLKYALEEPARSFSGAADYFPVATAAIEEMYRQVGPCVFDGEGLLLRGVVIRHLLLPGQLENARQVMDYVSRRFPEGEVLFSLMNQYTPQKNAEGILARRCTGAEYKAALRYMENCGISAGFTQDKESARAEYTPAFDLTGV